MQQVTQVRVQTAPTQRRLRAQVSEQPGETRPQRALFTAARAWATSSGQNWKTGPRYFKAHALVGDKAPRG